MNNDKIWIRREICIKQRFQAQNSFKQVCGWILMWKTTGNLLFHCGEALLWIMHSYLGQKQQCNDGFVSYKQLLALHKMWTDGLEWCGLLWCFYQLCGLSFWWYPFTTEHPFLSRRMLHFSKSDEETNPSWMAWEWIQFQQMFIFGWTILCDTHTPRYWDAMITFCRYYRTSSDYFTEINGLWILINANC